MGRKTWTRCVCGKKIRVKSGNTVCYTCSDTKHHHKTANSKRGANG